MRTTSPLGDWSRVNIKLNQRLFMLAPDAWRVFNRVLDNPPLPNERLKALIARKPPWPE